MKYSLTILIIIVLGALSIWYFQSRSFPIPSGETTSLGEQEGEMATENHLQGESSSNPSNTQMSASQREILVTDGVKHSIPLNEILSGGPGKDGIPSIDDPKFVSVSDATFLNNDEPGLGLTVNGESRFYPYKILVWHEIVNDTTSIGYLLPALCHRYCV